MPPVILRAAIGLGFLVGILYGRAVGYGFVYDDRALVELNPSLSDWSTLPEALAHDLFHFAPQVRTSTYWRPVVSLSYYVDHALGGGSAWMFHLTNLLALWSAALGLCVFVGRAGASTLLSGALAVLFLVHPIQVEGAANVAARTDLFCAAFGIWAMTCRAQARMSWPGC